MRPDPNTLPCQKSPSNKHFWKVVEASKMPDGREDWGLIPGEYCFYCDIRKVDKIAPIGAIKEKTMSTKQPCPVCRLQIDVQEMGNELIFVTHLSARPATEEEREERLHLRNVKDVTCPGSETKI